MQDDHSDDVSARVRPADKARKNSRSAFFLSRSPIYFLLIRAGHPANFADGAIKAQRRTIALNASRNIHI